MRERYQKIIKWLIDELYFASELFIGYKAIYNKQFSDLDLLNWTPGFFKITMYSYLNLSALMLYRMYDATETISLNKMISILEQNYIAFRLCPEESKRAIVESKRLFGTQQDSVLHLKTLRDKTLAHNDMKMLTTDVWIDEGLTIGDYQSLINTAQEILCLCGKQIDVSSPLLGMGIDKDIDFLIDVIKAWEESKLQPEL